MKKRFGTILIATAALALALTSLAPVDDWPQFMGPNRDGVSKETGLLKKWPESGPRQVWKQPIGKGFSCMSIAGGRLFTMNQKDGGQWVLAFDADTGKPLWKVRTGDEDNGRGYPGPRATPTVDGDLVYALDATNRLFCLKAATGDIVWSHDLLAKYRAKSLTWAASASPLVDGDRVIVNVGESQGASIVALNKKTGEEVWKSLDDMAGYSSPIIRTISGKRQYVFFMATGAMGVDPADGSRLWHIPWKTKYDIHAATPIVQGDHVFIASDYGTGCGLIKVDLASKPPAKLVLKSKVIQAKFTTPILIDGYLYAFDEQRKLRCVSMLTLESKWEAGGFNNGTLVVADGMAFILGERGNLALAKLSPNGLDIVSQVDQVLTGSKNRRCWTMPVVANGKLYARDESELICLDVAGK